MKQSELSAYSPAFPFAPPFPALGLPAMLQARAGWYLPPGVVTQAVGTPSRPNHRDKRR